MIHYEPLVEMRLTGAFSVEVGSLYFYSQREGDPYEERKPYIGVGTVIWETPHRVWLRALRADMDRHMQRELLAWLVKRDIRCVKADREPGRALPFARRVGDHFEVDVAELVARVHLSGVPKEHRRATDPPAQA